MEKYLGVKMIDAKPMTRLEYNEYRGWELPEDENGNDLGMIKDDGNGHQQWDPIDVFEKAYRQINNGIPLDKGNWQVHQERVVSEARELRENKDKLDIFITSNDIFNTLPEDEQNRLKQQLMVMTYYLTILIERIDNF